ncbi:hypothetical protein AALO_G00177400 [Alosa alosa]|uniref:MARVEL domain-containing protein n=1 Tax=Alosa alosa TaxID=278164 RepID=A0AAV6G809_9TELE|nr:CKLF-like MARVEL transmembrane domain-containing protein 6 [Alosa alosa]KAG5271234.1 hypothetical protein AALO_G00177400 [Alosa alosa]
MADSQTYNTTTAPLDQNQKSNKFGHLGIWGFVLKLAEVFLSFLAFVLEEVVSTCNACSLLYFFEFVSCTAFLFTLLLLILLASSLHKKVGINSWDRLDFVYTILITVLFLLASGLFLWNNSGSVLEKAAGGFGLFSSVVFSINVIYLFMAKRNTIIGKTNDKPTNQQQQQQQPENPEAVKLTNGQEV